MQRHTQAAIAGLVVLLAVPAAGQGLTDAQIAGIVVAANQVDIDAGKVAASKAAGAETKAFANEMVEAHTAVNRQAAELAGKLGIKPESTPTAESLRAGGTKNEHTLAGLSGAAFDREYIGHEVVYHQQVLDALDKTLIPGAKNPELKALLEKVRPAFVAHLTHAQAIQEALARPAGGR